MFALVALGFVLSVGHAEVRQSLSVPKDSSLSIREYMAKGIPDPSADWTVNQYEKALGTLGGLPRYQLPRMGSDRSSVLFDRLLSCYLKEFELSLGTDSTSHAFVRVSVPSLPDLYSTARNDHLLFDRELIAIRLGNVTRSIGDLAPRSLTEEQAKRYGLRLESASSAQERAQLGASLRRAEQLILQTSELVTDQVSEVIIIASIPEIGELARKELLEGVKYLTPELPRFLLEDDIRWVATLLKAAARSEYNVAISEGLLKLAGQLDNTRPKT